MKILLLPRYPRHGASSRYRLWQYLPLLERAGHAVEAWPLVDERYLISLYRSGRRPCRPLAGGYARRMMRLGRLGEFDLVVCEREAFPYLPAAAELPLLRRCARLILDYDDAAYVPYQRWPLLWGKIPRLMARAEAVVAGSRHLADYARVFARRVHRIPTVVDTSRYRQRRHGEESETLRIVWVGTPATAPLLEPLRMVLAELERRHPRLVLRVIGAGRAFSPAGLRCESLAWSEQTEAERLAECDIGIMPLPDNEFTRGKCGLKLIQYMASGLPVVASAVGANADIVNDGHNGMLARTSDDWLVMLDALLRDADLRRRMGRAGRARAVAEYSLEAGFAQWGAVIGGGNSPAPAQPDSGGADVAGTALSAQVDSRPR
jgi:glycosyltransferase involved in cell wall biosynthesis